jgi:hypothetical protein
MPSSPTPSAVIGDTAATGGNTAKVVEVWGRWPAPAAGEYGGGGWWETALANARGASELHMARDHHHVDGWLPFTAAANDNDGRTLKPMGASIRHHADTINPRNTPP